MTIEVIGGSWIFTLGQRNSCQLPEINLHRRGKVSLCIDLISFVSLCSTQLMAVGDVLCWQGQCGKGMLGTPRSSWLRKECSDKSSMSLGTARIKGRSEGLDQSCDVITLMGADDSGSCVLGGLWSRKPRYYNDLGTMNITHKINAVRQSRVFYNNWRVF